MLHSQSDQGTFKVDGLIKKVSSSPLFPCPSLIDIVPQTITVTIDGSDLHLISYYTSEDIRSGKLKVRAVSQPGILLTACGYPRGQRTGPTSCRFTCLPISFARQTFVFHQRWRMDQMENNASCEWTVRIFKSEITAHS